MRLADWILSLHSKKDDNGRLVYFPAGVAGKGYVLPTDQSQRARIGRAMFWRQVILNLAAFVILSFAAVFSFFAYKIPELRAWAVGVGAGAVGVLVWGYFTDRRIVERAMRGLVISDARWTVSDAFATVQSAAPAWLPHISPMGLGLGILLVVGFVLGCVLAVAMGALLVDLPKGLGL